MSAPLSIPITGYFGVLRMSGATRLDFVHRMSSGEVAGLRPGQIAATCFTTPNGRIVDWTQVLCLDDALLFLTGGGNQDRLRRWLSKYIFFNDDVRIVDESAQMAIDAWVEPVNLPEAARTLAVNTLTVVDGAHLAALNYGAQPLIVRLVAASDALAGSGLAEFDAWRVAAGVPRFPNEIGEAYIPLESGLWSAVSFHKGCYVGQEIIARMESRKRVVKKLAVLQAAAALTPGVALHTDGVPAGIVTSCVGTHALGYVRSAALDAGSVLNAGGVPVRVSRVVQL
jgi:aminomethyltransferase